MMTTYIRILALASLLLIASVSCSSGGGNGDNVAGGGTGGTGISSGTITRFGSIFVNGVEFETTGAIITLDDQPGTEDQLAVGQVVIVSGTYNADGATGTATSVVFKDNVEGPIDSIDLVNSRLVVLGQTVLVDGATSFDDDISPRSLEGLSVGDFVEVSGFVKANGEIAATRIERKVSGGELEVKGTVSALDSANRLFNINALTVDYSGATLDDFPSGVPGNGDFVEAECARVNFNDCFGLSGEFLATKVELEGLDIDVDEGDEVEIEGFITRFVDEFDFDVAGQPVTTNAQTEFEDGTAADLGLNVKVEVEGRVDASGVLVAEEIEIRRPNNIKIEATVDAVDVATTTVTLLGIAVRVDRLTRFEDDSAAELRPFGIEDIGVGDFLAVRGFEDPPGSGSVLATRVERDDFEPDVVLQGSVTSVSQPSFVILGVTIETDITTVFEDENDNIITAAEFFASVATGQLVKAEGVESGPALITADEVEFE